MSMQIKPSQQLYSGFMDLAKNTGQQNFSSVLNAYGKPLIIKTARGDQKIYVVYNAGEPGSKLETINKAGVAAYLKLLASNLTSQHNISPEQIPIFDLREVELGKLENGDDKANQIGNKLLSMIRDNSIILSEENISPEAIEDAPMLNNGSPTLVANSNPAPSPAAYPHVEHTADSAAPTLIIPAQLALPPVLNTVNVSEVQADGTGEELKTQAKEEKSVAAAAAKAKEAAKLHKASDAENFGKHAFAEVVKLALPTLRDLLLETERLEKKLKQNDSEVEKGENRTAIQANIENNQQILSAVGELIDLDKTVSIQSDSQPYNARDALIRSQSTETAQSQKNELITALTTEGENGFLKPINGKQDIQKVADRAKALKPVMKSCLKKAEFEEKEIPDSNGAKAERKAQLKEEIAHLKRAIKILDEILGVASKIEEQEAQEAQEAKKSNKDTANPDLSTLTREQLIERMKVLMMELIVLLAEVFNRSSNIGSKVATAKSVDAAESTALKESAEAAKISETSETSEIAAAAKEGNEGKGAEPSTDAEKPAVSAETAPVTEAIESPAASATPAPAELNAPKA